MTVQISIFLIAFFIGAVPFGLILAKILGQDLRQVGSGNTGAANLARVSKSLGALGVILDALKPLIAFWLIGQFCLIDEQEKIIIACASVLGHCYSPYLKFKGGKGIATAFGTLFLFDVRIAIGALCIYAIVAGVTRMSALGNLFSPISAVVLAWFLTGDINLVGAYAAIALLIFWRHRANIKRIINGTEPKLSGKAIAALVAGAGIMAIIGLFVG